MRTGSTNTNLRQLIVSLKLLSHKEEAKIWARIAKDLEKPSRLRRIVNISRINRYTKDGETVIVPGKVLGVGIIKHKLNVAAYSFSESARLAIRKAKGNVLSIDELIKQNPKGEKIRIFG